LLFIECKIFNF